MNKPQKKNQQRHQNRNNSSTKRSTGEYLCDGDVLDQLVLVEVEALGQQLVLLLTVAQRKHVTVTPTVYLYIAYKNGEMFVHQKMIVRKWLVMMTKSKLRCQEHTSLLLVKTRLWLPPHAMPTTFTSAGRSGSI